MPTWKPDDSITEAEIKRIVEERFKNPFPTGSLVCHADHRGWVGLVVAIDFGSTVFNGVPTYLVWANTDGGGHGLEKWWGGNLSSFDLLHPTIAYPITTVSLPVTGGL